MISGAGKNREYVPGTSILRRGRGRMTRLSRGLSGTVINIIISCGNVAITSSAGLHGRLHRGNISCFMIGGAVLNHTVTNASLTSVDSTLRNAATVTLTGRSCATTTEVLYGFNRARPSFGIGANFLSKGIISARAVSTLTGLPAGRMLLTAIYDTFRTPVTTFTHTMRTVISGRGRTWLGWGRGVC